MGNIRLFIFISVIILACCGNWSCKDKKCSEPGMYVDFQISLDDPEFFPLNAPGTAVIVSRGPGYYGYQGVIVYRNTETEFFAYDNTCPHDAKKLIIESGWIAKDTVCGSTFALPLNGAVQEPPSECPLYQYDVQFNPETNFLRVTNR